MINYIRNLIHIKDVTVDCDIINNFEEKIKVFKSVKNYANVCKKIIDVIKLNSQFKPVYRKYNINMCSDKQADVDVLLYLDYNKWSNTLEFNLHIKYFTSYEKIIYLKIDAETAKLISFDCSETNIPLVRIIFSMLLSEVDRLNADFNYKNKIIAKILYKDDLPFTQDVGYVDEILI